MSHIITKDEYFAALDDEKTKSILDRTNRQAMDLKHIQDAWILYRLRDAEGLKILEIGGGHSRALRFLADRNEIWNLDDFGSVGTPRVDRKVPNIPGIKIVPEMLGSFSKEVPDGYFDVVVSISVIEHVPISVFPDFWSDHARVMKADGIAYHAIDFYVGDEEAQAVERRFDDMFSAWKEVGLVPQQLSLERPVVFRSYFASNPDYGMWSWNSYAPQLAYMRSVAQSVSFGAVLRRV
ncbi:MAG: class I SAM-dependent methyltransferase [Bauldia sp.]|nr:class I SAM-dependent methyltransferase [Bauldia sp.]